MIRGGNDIETQCSLNQSACQHENNGCGNRSIFLAGLK